LLNQRVESARPPPVDHLAAAGGSRPAHLDRQRPQASLTQGILGPDATRSLAAADTIFSLYDGSTRMTSGCDLSADWPGVALVPGLALRVEFCDGVVGSRDELRRRGNLGGWLREIAVGSCDVALIDCPLRSAAAPRPPLAAATDLIVPLQAEDYGAQGITPVLREYERYRDRVRFLGLLVTMFDRRLKLHQLFAEDLPHALPRGNVFRRGPAPFRGRDRVDLHPQGRGAVPAEKARGLRRADQALAAEVRACAGFAEVEISIAVETESEAVTHE